MACPKCSRTLNKCSKTVSSDCINFQGADNECLDFCEGQSVTEVIEQIADVVCDIKTDTDVSEQVIPSCSSAFYDSLGFTEKNVANMVDFILQYECFLKAAIDSINANLVTFSPNVDVDWKCLEQNPCTSTGLVTLNTAFENLITFICGQEERISSLESEITGLTTSITSLQSQYSTLQSQYTALQASYISLQNNLSNLEAVVLCINNKLVDGSVITTCL